MRECELHIEVRDEQRYKQVVRVLGAVADSLQQCTVRLQAAAARCINVNSARVLMQVLNKATTLHTLHLRGIAHVLPQLLTTIHSNLPPSLIQFGIAGTFGLVSIIIVIVNVLILLLLL